MHSTDTISDLGFRAPTHHPASELLIDYASGGHSPAESLLIELHLAYCAECRRSVETLFAAGGALLDALPGVPLPAGLFNRTLRLIDRMDSVPPGRLPSAIPPFATDWPRPLRDRIARHGLREWRRLPAGFRALPIPFARSKTRVLVLKAPGGRGPFRHTHTKDEWTVVLEGGYRDDSGSYAAGDFACAGQGYEHTVVAERGEGCVCVVLSRARPVYTTLLGKLTVPLTRV